MSPKPASSAPSSKTGLSTTGPSTNGESPESEDETAGGFDAFDLDVRIIEAVKGLGFDTPTPIQSEAIPVLLSGRDVIGRARTGSGKTAAFGLPMLHRLREGGRHVRAILLTPTRELALQVSEALRSYAKRLPVRVLTVYGGAPYGPQLRGLKDGVPIVVGTPGRVIDHLKKGSLDLSKVEVVILDEADEMLRMGFLEDVELLLAAVPEERQTALFSATMPNMIRRIAQKRMKDPLEIQVEESALTAKHITQGWMMVPQRFKFDALTRVLASEAERAALVFARTKAGCGEVADRLAQRGILVDALHGDLNQAARERVLTRLRARQLDVVIATDVAARGLDVQHLGLVINLDLPNDTEQYVHRIGRTGRAGREGLAISFVTPREQGRIAAMARSLDAAIEQLEVPSDAKIASGKTGRLLKELEGADTQGVEALLSQLGDGGVELSHEDLARAALSLLAKERGLDPRIRPDPDPPSWGRLRAPRAARNGGPGPRDARSETRGGFKPDANYVSLFLSIGKRRNVRPGDIVGAMTGELGISGDALGRITILDFKTFVEMRQADAGRALGQELEIRGHKVRIAEARPREQQSAHSPQKGGGFKRPHRGKKGSQGNKKRWNRNK